MYETLMLMSANVPQTGDNFPKGVLFAIIGAAVLLAAGTAVFAKKKGADSDNDEEDDDE
ncbi:MAG: hypothetical protein IKW96_00615 [Ruminococcus sp.]|uniref:hypothetical protein n=1 Tax=Ruminococcus sp. TaxID=41978 RepID=UPI0025D134F5|nr:hypothetical protein [Ruminococcus sp.]MBR5681767.1 hypothetical protein [Ruminococcus sp.]